MSKKDVRLDRNCSRVQKICPFQAYESWGYAVHTVDSYLVSCVKHVCYVQPYRYDMVWWGYDDPNSRFQAFETNQAVMYCPGGARAIETSSLQSGHRTGLGVTARFRACFPHLLMATWDLGIRHPQFSENPIADMVRYLSWPVACHGFMKWFRIVANW